MPVAESLQCLNLHAEPMLQWSAGLYTCITSNSESGTFMHNYTRQKREIVGKTEYKPTPLAATPA